MNLTIKKIDINSDVEIFTDSKKKFPYKIVLKVPFNVSEIGTAIGFGTVEFIKNDKNIAIILSFVNTDNELVQVIMQNINANSVGMIDIMRKAAKKGVLLFLAIDDKGNPEPLYINTKVEPKNVLNQDSS